MTQSPPPPDQGWNSPPPTTDATAPPPAPAWSGTPTPTTTAVTVARPGLVTAGAVTLIVLGAVTVLIGLLFLLGGAMFAGGGAAVAEQAGVPAELEGMLGALGGVLVVIALVVLALGGAEIWIAIKALAGQSWARIAGIALSAAFALLWLLGAFGEQGVQILNLIFVAAYAFVIYAFWAGGGWFAARRV